MSISTEQLKIIADMTLELTKLRQGVTTSNKKLLSEFERVICNLEGQDEVCYSVDPSKCLPSMVISSMCRNGSLVALFWGTSEAVLCIEVGNNWHEVSL